MANTIKIKDNRSTYPGGKGGSGVHQNIINLIPPHEVYIETHLGGGYILRKKRPAATNIGIDLDPEVIKAWDRSGICKNNEWIRQPSPEIKSGDDGQYFNFIKDDATRYLKKYQFTGNEFVYADPPYLRKIRKGPRKLYDYEMTDQDHMKLLSCLHAIPAKIMISGYWSSLYMDMLPGWNTHNFEAQTRNGMATEWLWFNYPVPEILHDYSFLGANFRERERIKKKRDRWVSRLLRIPALERNAMVESLKNCQHQELKTNEG